MLTKRIFPEKINQVSVLNCRLSRDPHVILGHAERQTLTTWKIDTFDLTSSNLI